MSGIYAEIGSILVKLDEFKFLKKHIQVLCNGNKAIELFFVVTGSTHIVKNRLLGKNIIIIPLTHSTFKSASFNSDLVVELAKKVGIIAVGHVHTNSTVKPSDEDIATSVLLDRKIGRPVYHIIMNNSAEYEVYSNSKCSDALHKPVDSQ